MCVVSKFASSIFPYLNVSVVASYREKLNRFNKQAESTNIMVTSYLNYTCVQVIPWDNHYKSIRLNLAQPECTHLQDWNALPDQNV